MGEKRAKKKFALVVMIPPIKFQTMLLIMSVLSSIFKVCNKNKLF